MTSIPCFLLPTARRALLPLLLVLLAGLLPAARVAAHGGPTFPIALDRPAGPFRISIWADPDVGSALFYVIVTDAAGHPLADAPAVDVWVQPIAGHHADVRYSAEKREINGQVQFVAAVNENVQGQWRVRAVARSPLGSGETAATVEGRLVGLGGWEVATYVFPFVAIGLLFLKGILTNRRQRA